MNDWTPESAETRLVEAATVLRRLPRERGQGYFSTRPQTFVAFSDLVGQMPEPMRLPPPSAAWTPPCRGCCGWRRSMRRSCGDGPAASAGSRSAGRSGWRGPRRTSTGSMRPRHRVAAKRQGPPKAH